MELRDAERWLTQEILKSKLSYDPETGIFIWLKPPKYHPRMKGHEAGCAATGYLMIRIDGDKFKAHRLAWLYVHGAFPECDLDHRDLDPFNNRIGNLRPSTNAQNQANKRKREGKVLPKGVRANGSGFTARISFQKRTTTIGTFDTPEEASAAYLVEAQRLYGEFARESR